MKFKVSRGFPGSSDGKESACNARDPGCIPGSGRSPGEGNGNPLQYACLENTMDREACQTTVLGVAKSQTQLSIKHFSNYLYCYSCFWYVSNNPLPNQKSSGLTCMFLSKNFMVFILNLGY